MENEKRSMIYHRILQFLLGPIFLVINLLMTGTILLALLDVNLNMIPYIRESATLNANENFFWIIVASIALIELVGIIAWFKSFKMSKGCYRLTILFFILLPSTAIYTLWYVISHSMYNTIGMDIRAYTGVIITAHMVLLASVVICMAVVFASILTLAYYINRRRMFVKLVPEKKVMEAKVEETVITPDEEVSEQVTTVSSPKEETAPTSVSENTSIDDTKQEAVLDEAKEVMPKPVSEAISDEVKEDEKVQDTPSDTLLEVADKVSETPIPETSEDEQKSLGSELGSLTENNKTEPVEVKSDIIPEQVKPLRKYCPNCGALLKYEEAKFCSQCGHQLK